MKECTTFYNHAASSVSHLVRPCLRPCQVSQRQGELSEEEEAARKALNLQIKDENRRRALERAEEMARQKELENQANADELRYRWQYWVTGRVRI